MIPPWLFAEFSPPVGVDLSSREAVESYDRNLGADPVRDRALLDGLNVGQGTVDRGEPADVVTIKSALHQLPDFWKQTALLNIADYIKPGGRLYI